MIVYTLAASGDLVDAYEYLIARGDIRPSNWTRRSQGPALPDRAATRSVAEVDRAAHRAAGKPRVRGPLTRLQSGAMVRSCRSTIRIVYTRDEDVLVILRVYHQARPPLK